jgi:Holliday junction resolvasome RuvABC DNA-binding subunit
LMVVLVSDYNDWKTQLQDLEDKFNKLKKYIQGGEKSQIVKNYSTSQQKALNKLVSKMEAKVKEWRVEKTKSEKNSQDQENPAWYKTPLGIIGIIAVVGIISIVIYYFVKKNINEED